AAAQPAAFSEALSEFAAAVEGTFGDEGPRVQPALDRMTAALAEWDRAIAAAEGQLDSPGGAPVPSHVEAHLAAGRMFAQRGRRAEALRHVDAAAEIAPRRGDVQLLRGLVLSALGRGYEAAGTFSLAWTLAPEDPVASYHALHA